MKRVIGSLALILIFSSQITCILVTDGPYMIAHFDNHKDAYIYWRIAHERNLIHDNMILVHFDAHHDMDCVIGIYYEQWLSTYMLSPREVKGITNATFIDAAVNEGLVKEIWWVMPDYLYWGWHFDQLETFVRVGEPRQFYKYVRFCDCREEGGHIACTLMDIHHVSPPLPTPDTYTKTHARVHFITLDMLPSFEEEVLLDIDTDYFMNKLDIARYPAYFYDDGDLRPWISVEKFMDALMNTGIKSRVVTIAVSPSYTHERYHYLSWLLAEHLEMYLSEIYSKREGFSLM